MCALVWARLTFWIDSRLGSAQAFGHERVSVLDGGLPRWEAEGHYIDTSVPQPINPHSAEEPKQTSYGPIMSELMYAKKPRVESYFIADIEEHMTEYPVPTLDESAVKNYEHMVDNSKLDLDQSEAEIVLDARPADRCDSSFTGHCSLRTDFWLVQLPRQDT